MVFAGMLRALFQDLTFRLAASFKIAIHADVSALHNHRHKPFLLFMISLPSRFFGGNTYSMSGVTAALAGRTGRSGTRTGLIEQTFNAGRRLLAISFGGLYEGPSTYSLFD